MQLAVAIANGYVRNTYELTAMRLAIWRYAAVAFKKDR